MAQNKFTWDSVSLHKALVPGIESLCYSWIEAQFKQGVEQLIFEIQEEAQKELPKIIKLQVERFFFAHQGTENIVIEVQLSGTKE